MATDLENISDEDAEELYRFCNERLELGERVGQSRLCMYTKLCEMKDWENKFQSKAEGNKLKKIDDTKKKLGFGKKKALKIYKNFNKSINDNNNLNADDLEFYIQLCEQFKFKNIIPEIITDNPDKITTNSDETIDDQGNI